jgi:3-oxoacyl-[acyl-carrier-protein] synthase I
MRPSQSEAETLAIVSLGLCSPLGLTARSTQAEVMAGTARIFETDVKDSWGEPVRASSLTLLPTDHSRSERMTALAITALTDCMQDAPAVKDVPLPCVLGVPEGGSGAAVDLQQLTDALLAAGATWRLQLADRGIIRAGRASFFQALCRAQELLSSHLHPFVLVGAVDSLCDCESLQMLARKRRTLGGPNRDGIIPGEGAGFVLLTQPHRQKANTWEKKAVVLACKLATDAHPFLRAQPTQGEGLTEAFRLLRAHPRAGTRRTDIFLSCQPMEAFWGQEFTYAYLRNGALLPEPLRGDSITGSLGDLGAAAGIVQLAMALHPRRNWRPQEATLWRALIYGSSDSGHVGACVVEVYA